jgi:hypothetical protein
MHASLHRCSIRCGAAGPQPAHLFLITRAARRNPWTPRPHIFWSSDIHPRPTSAAANSASTNASNLCILPPMLSFSARPLPPRRSLQFPNGWRTQTPRPGIEPGLSRDRRKYLPLYYRGFAEGVAKLVFEDGNAIGRSRHWGIGRVLVDLIPRPPIDRLR